jgi:hypothetical protein
MTVGSMKRLVSGVAALGAALLVAIPAQASGAWTDLRLPSTS